jgi:hypothetical protein
MMRKYRITEIIRGLSSTDLPEITKYVHTEEEGKCRTTCTYVYMGLFIKSLTPWWKECHKLKKYTHTAYPSQVLSGY